MGIIFDDPREMLVLLQVVGLDVNLEVHHHKDFPLRLAQHNPSLAGSKRQIFLYFLNRLFAQFGI